MPWRARCTHAGALGHEELSGGTALAGDGALHGAGRARWTGLAGQLTPVILVGPHGTRVALHLRRGVSERSFVAGHAGGLTDVGLELADGAGHAGGGPEARPEETLGTRGTRGLARRGGVEPWRTVVAPELPAVLLGLARRTHRAVRQRRGVVEASRLAGQACRQTRVRAVQARDTVATEGLAGAALGLAQATGQTARGPIAGLEAAGGTSPADREPSRGGESAGLTIQADAAPKTVLETAPSAVTTH